MQLVKPGIYKHFKNKKEYRVVGVGLLTAPEDTEVVMYEPMYESEYRFFVRPVGNFLEEVEYEGTKQPRFVFLRDN